MGKKIRNQILDRHHSIKKIDFLFFVFKNGFKTVIFERNRNLQKVLNRPFEHV